MTVTFNMEERSDAILVAADPETQLEAWEPEDFDHFTDLGLLRPELCDLG